MLSLSHVVIVAVVVAAVVALWKFERRSPRSSAGPRAQPRPIGRQLLKLALLIVFVLGALTPAFGLEGGYLHYIHIVCTGALAVLAYLWLFPKGQW